jgi:hypothetical protein
MEGAEWRARALFLLSGLMGARAGVGMLGGVRSMDMDVEAKPESSGKTCMSSSSSSSAGWRVPPIVTSSSESPMPSSSSSSHGDGGVCANMDWNPGMREGCLHFHPRVSQRLFHTMGSSASLCHLRQTSEQWRSACAGRRVKRWRANSTGSDCFKESALNDLGSAQNVLQRRRSTEAVLCDAAD